MSEGVMLEESESEVVEERRAYGRIEVECPIRVEAPVRTEGHTLELSEGGARVELEDDVSRATRVSIQLELPDRTTPIGTIADIRWHEKVGSREDPRWICGLQFTELDGDEEAAIEELIEKLRD
ncbi:MAG: PilZ domain-containing protein [Bradymonadaceae bacterium]